MCVETEVVRDDGRLNLEERTALLDDRLVAYAVSWQSTVGALDVADLSIELANRK